MARVLVEIDDFTASITVPEAGDARSDAAEVVADIGQRLANRTKNLERLDGEKAVLADANTFTAAPQSVDSTDNEVALFESPRGSLDDASVGGTNDWKLIANLKCDSTRRYRTYTGGNDAAGHSAVTLNAHWHKSDSKWRPDTNGKDSFAYFIVGEQLVVARQAAGPTSWTSWPTDKGDVVVGGEVLYAAPKRRTTLLNLNEAQGAVLRLDASGRVTFDTSAPGGSVEISFAVHLPVNSVIIGADVLVNKHDAANPPTVKFRARPAIASDFTSPAAINMFTRDTAVGAASTGMESLHLDPSAGGGGYLVDGTEEFQITFARGGGVVAVIDETHAVRVIWDDYGYRNDR